MVLGTPGSQDPLPEYVSPELVRLIAKNAPTELDFFVQYLHRPKPSPRSVPWKLQKSPRDVQAERERETRAAAVEELLRGIKDRNDWIAARKTQGGYKSWSAEQTARSDPDTLSSTRSSPPKHNRLLSRKKERRDVSLGGLEMNVTRILGRNFTLTKHAERVQWPLPPEARYEGRNGEELHYHRLKKRDFGSRLSRQALNELPLPSAKFKEFFASRAEMTPSSTSSDEIFETPSPPARKQKFPLKRVVPGDWQTFESDAEIEDKKYGVSFKLEKFPPSRTKATIDKSHAAWIPSGTSSKKTFGEFVSMGPHSSRPSSARLPVGNRPISPAWVPPGQPSRRPMSAPCSHSVPKASSLSKHDASGKESAVSDAPETFKRAWEDFKTSEDVGKRPFTPYLKPWRCGMATTSRPDVRAEAKECKPAMANDRSNQEKLAEITKFMEAKQSQWRKEKRDLKRKAEAEVTAKKEKERLLQLHHQAMLEIEAEQAKEKPLKVRPAWNPDFDSARADGIGPWASPENNVRPQEVDSHKATVSHHRDESPGRPVVDTRNKENALRSSDSSTEETVSNESRNIHVVLRPKKRGKGKPRQQKPQRPTIPKDPFVGSKKRARWKSSTTMNQYGGNDALKRRELMKIYGVRQVQPKPLTPDKSTVKPVKREQREALDNRKKQSLRSGRKNATSSSSTKTVKKKSKTKSKGGRKGECVTRGHTTSVQGAPESARITPSADTSQASKTGGSTVTTQTPKVSEKGKHAIKETSKGQTCGQSRHIDGKLELPLSRKTKSEQVHTESLPALRKAKIQTLSKSATKICTQSVTTAGTKDKKQDCPALVYFSEPTQNSTLTNFVRPESPSKQFPSTLTTGGNIHKTRPLEKETQKVYGGGFHFKSACKASASVTSVKMSVGSPTSAAETARGQRAIDSSSCLQASYSAMVIPERAHHCVTLDLNEWEQAGPLQSAPKRPTSKQNSSDTPGKLTLLSGSKKAMRQGNAATTNCLEHVSPKGQGQQSTLLSPPNPSNTIDDKKRQKDALSQGSGGYGKEGDRPPYLDGEEEVLHSRSKYDKEWTLPKRGDSFSIVNLYAKHKAHISPAQESTATTVSYECGLGRKTASYSIPQKARPLTAKRPVPNHRSPSSSSEFRTYIATCYGDEISNLSESETLFSEILAEACKNKERRLSRKPSATDFIRSVSKEVSKANGSAEENAIFCHQTETSGPRQRIPKTRISEAVSKDSIQTMKLDVRQPTSTLKNSVQMPSARMQSKLPCELSDMSVDGISMLPPSKACVRDGYTDIFSYDDAEAIALHKVRMQLRKEQRLMRKLRRKQKVEAATFKARLGDEEMINSNSSKHLVHTQKVSELGVSTMSASTQAKILPLMPGEVLPPRHSHASVQEHPPDTRTTKTRPPQVKLNKKGPRKKVHGASKLMKVLGPKKESMPSVVQQAFVLENSIQQSTAKVTGKKLLPTQHNCQILSQNTFGPKASSMTYNLDETNRRCISSAVKIISIEDIASDSSQGRASPEPVAGHCEGHELPASNGGGYSDSFLSNSTTFDQSKSLVPASLHNNLAAAEIVKDVSVEKSNPTPTLHETGVWCIADTSFGHNRMNTAVMPTTAAASQHNQKPLPIAHTSEVMDSKNEKDLQERVTTCDVTSPLSGKEKCSLKPRVGSDSLEKAKLQSSSTQPYILGSQAVHSDAQAEDHSNRTLHAANFESAAWLRDIDRIAASRLAAKTGEETFGGTNATGSGVSRDLQNVKAQTICEIDASKIDEEIIPCKRMVQPEFITDGLSTVELPSFHQNSRETGQIFLAHSPSIWTMRDLGSQGNDIRESKLFSGLSKPFTLAFPMSPGARYDEEECGESPRKSHAQLDLKTNLATSSQITSSLVNNLVKPSEDIDPPQTVEHAGGRIKPKPSKQEEILKEEISKNSEPERECTSMPTYLPPAIVTSQLITYEDFVPEEALCTEVTSTFQDEESLHCLSIPLQTVHTASNLQLSSSRRSRTEKTRNYREGDDNDSMNSITSPFQTVAHLDDENAAVRVDKDIPTTSPSQHNSEASWKIIKSSPYDPDKCQIANKTEPPGLNIEHHVEIEKESLYSYLTMRQTQNPGAENLFQRAEAEETFSKGSYHTLSSRRHTSQDAGSLEKFVNSGDDIPHSSTEGAPEAKKVGNKEASPLEQPHDSMRNGENVLQLEAAVLRSPVTSVEEQDLINTAQRNWESKDEEELICEDLDVGTDVSTFFITEDMDQTKVNSDYMSSTWIDEEEQSQICGSNGATMISQDQEEVTSLFTDHAEENRETCSISPAIPAVLINSRNPLDMANVSAGANNSEKSCYDSCKFSTNAHAQLTGLAEMGAEQATDPTAASLAKIGDMKSEADDKLPARLHEQTTFPEVNGGFSIKSAVKLDTFSSATSSTNTCYLEPQNSNEVLNPKEKRQAYGAYSTAKHNLLANFLTGTLLDTMLREELADTAKRKVQSSLGATSEKRDDPSHNPGSSCYLPTIGLPESAKRLAQSKRKGPLFTALSSPLGVRVSNQAAVKPYQALEKESRIGSSQDENDLSRSLTPAYAAQYVQTLLKPSCMQGTEIAEKQHLIVDVKAITATPTESNHNTVHKKQLASQNMYNKLLCDAVNDSFRQQTTSYNPRLVQLAGVKTYTNSCKPMSANDAIKTALASIVDDVKFANTARSAGHARCLLQLQVMASCEEWQTSWLETNDLLVSELADGILTEMLGSMVLEMPGTRLPDRALCRSTV